MEKKLNISFDRECESNGMTYKYSYTYKIDKMQSSMNKDGQVYYKVAVSITNNLNNKQYAGDFELYEDENKGCDYKIYSCDMNGRNKEEIEDIFFVTESCIYEIEDLMRGCIADREEVNEYVIEDFGIER